MGYLNPLLKLPAGRALLALPAEDRPRIEAVMRELRAQANIEAEKSWARRKRGARGLLARGIHLRAALGACAVCHDDGLSRVRGSLKKGRRPFRREAYPIARPDAPMAHRQKMGAASPRRSRPLRAGTTRRPYALAPGPR